MTIKLSEEQLARYGCKTQEEVIAALDKTLEKPKPPEPPAAAAPAPAPADVSASLYRLGELYAGCDVRLKAIETTVKTLAPETILASAATEAKRVASLEVSAAIARAGGAALGQKSDPADPAPGGKKEISPTDYAAQYDADANLREEFSSKATYIKYMEGLAAGRFRVHPLANAAQN